MSKGKAKVLKEKGPNDTILIEFWDLLLIGGFHCELMTMVGCIGCFVHMKMHVAIPCLGYVISLVCIKLLYVAQLMMICSMGEIGAYTNCKR